MGSEEQVRSSHPGEHLSEFTTEARRHGGVFHFVALALSLLPWLGCQKAAPVEQQVTTPQVAAPIPVTVAAVEVRPVQRRVSVVGALYGLERITVTPKVEGRVLATYFDVGDRVPPSTKLLELDPTDHQLAVNEAQQAVELELARLDLAKPPAESFDIEQLPSVQSARIKLENAKRHFDRQKGLTAQGGGAGQIYDQAETDLKVAETGIRQARIDARTTLATVRHRESVLMLAKQRLNETVVKAPSLGGLKASGEPADYVITKRMVSTGEMVRAFPSTPVYELMVDDVLKLHVMVPERYIAQVKNGLDVEVRVEAYPGEVFPGKVMRINPTIDPQSRSFDVEAHIPNPDHRLKPGGFAKAEVVVGAADAAVTVPIEAVTRFAGISKVFRVRDNKAEEVVISIGAQGPGWIEALGGLEAGDVIVTSGQSKLSNGTAISVREAAKAEPAEKQATENSSTESK
jgi:RND family efflux transporter MFP subunit